MTFQQLFLECIDLHFMPEDVKPSNVKRWVNLAEMELWNAADWVFKRVAASSLPIVAGSRTPVMPTDFGKTRVLVDNNGDELKYLDPQDWERAYAADTSTGPPHEFTVINRQIFVGPTPSASATFKHGYRRRYAHLNAASAVVAGTMALGDDVPLWDVEFHYVLVPWAMLLGGTLTDQVAFARGHVFSYASVFESQRDDALEAMKDELALSGVEAQTLQYG